MCVAAPLTKVFFNPEEHKKENKRREKGQRRKEGKISKNVYSFDISVIKWGRGGSRGVINHIFFVSPPSLLLDPLQLLKNIHLKKSVLCSAHTQNEISK